ncbi:lytic transglycosylase domain-containing protein [Brevibacterium ihuae]|uniref:lytic transglycosylase domain-containing protein n=1 Tax=Brevibacterium ihuae TaxID=1631743 RepID=UPI000C7762FD|nr:lytic murein transglycosylase [Brevibacterium ihuae]
MSSSSRLFVIIAGSLAVVLAVAAAALMARLMTQPDQVAAPEEGISGPPPVAPAPVAPTPSVAAPSAGATPAPGETSAPGEVDSQWLADIARSTGIPERVLQSYVAAGVWAAENRQTCRLGWNTLAAIGSVETNHGRYEGSSVQPDGNLDRPIVGAQLDGVGVASIPDTDDGRLDGDDEYDRAVGPMQFIPDSWNRHGLDGNGDGRKDPNNIDDAVMTAASYLCTSGDLASTAGWERAVLSYNNSLDYVMKVYNAALVYARAVDPGAPAPAPRTVPASTPAPAPGRNGN